MPKLQYHIRQPVRRPGAEIYLLVTLFSFGLSVSFTRFFLAISGYPQLGGEQLHIAHVLWGGLLLYIASLLPLLLANRWVYPITAFLSGTGVGLFIDEVGKFITQNNDYFYPPAAPIIYAFFMLTTLLYTRIRRKPSTDPRYELYEIFEELEEVLDHDLDEQERAGLIAKLEAIQQKDIEPDLRKLTFVLLDYVQNGEIKLASSKSTLLDTAAQKIKSFELKFLHKTSLRAILSGSMFALGIVALIQIVSLFVFGEDASPVQKKIAELIQSGILTQPGQLDWYSAWLALDGSTGLLFIISAMLLAFGKDRRGIHLSYLSLLLALTISNLFLFYFDQFSSIINASIQLLVLWGVIRYRQKYLTPDPQLPVA